MSSPARLTLERWVAVRMANEIVDELESGGHTMQPIDDPLTTPDQQLVWAIQKTLRSETTVSLLNILEQRAALHQRREGGPPVELRMKGKDAVWPIEQIPGVHDDKTPGARRVVEISEEEYRTLTLRRSAARLQERLDEAHARKLFGFDS